MVFHVLRFCAMTYHFACPCIRALDQAAPPFSLLEQLRVAFLSTLACLSNEVLFVMEAATELPFDSPERRLTTKFIGVVVPTLVAGVANSCNSHFGRDEIAKFVVGQDGQQGQAGDASTATGTSWNSSATALMKVLWVSRIHALHDEIALLPRHPAYALAQTCRLHRRNWSTPMLALLYDCFEPLDFIHNLPSKRVLPFVDWRLARHAVGASSFFWVCEMMMLKAQGDEGKEDEDKRRRNRALARRIVHGRAVRSIELDAILTAAPRADAQKAWKLLQGEEAKVRASASSTSSMTSTTCASSTAPLTTTTASTPEAAAMAMIRSEYVTKYKWHVTTEEEPEEA